MRRLDQSTRNLQTASFPTCTTDSPVRGALQSQLRLRSVCLLQMSFQEVTPSKYLAKLWKSDTTDRSRRELAQNVLEGDD